MIYTVAVTVLSYIAIVALLMHGPLESVTRHGPAVIVVIMTRRSSPMWAAVGAFLLGLAVDAVTGGPLGWHAAWLVAMAAWFSRGNDFSTARSAWWWMAAVFVAAAGDGILPAVSRHLPTPQWSQLETAALSCFTTAGLLSSLIGLAVGITRHTVFQTRGLAN